MACGFKSLSGYFNNMNTIVDTNAGIYHKPYLQSDGKWIAACGLILPVAGPPPEGKGFVYEKDDGEEGYNPTCLKCIEIQIKDDYMQAKIIEKLLEVISEHTSWKPNIGYIKPSAKSHKCGCCCCSTCHEHHDDCVCEHNEIETKINEILGNDNE